MDPTRMCELLVGLPDVNVLAVVDMPGEAWRVVIETREQRRSVPAATARWWSRIDRTLSWWT